MIVTTLKGGLGNQMFQYASARRLALRHKTKLFMDLSWFYEASQVDTHRFYELDCFKLDQKFKKRPSFVVAEPDPSLKVRAYKYTKGLVKPRLQPYIEKTHQFDKAVLDLPNNVYLDGYWQNEKYFIDIRDRLLEDFDFKQSPSRKNQLLIEQIGNSNAVSLHVRRGDYAADKATNAFHGLVELDYYQKAIELMSKKLKQPHFFVFSDEPAWCKKNLKLGFPTTYVSGNKSGFEDMRLMTHCAHHITANSSFSWWGAWLNPKADKIVIAPKRWFNDPSMGKAEIVPESWIKL